MKKKGISARKLGLAMIFVGIVGAAVLFMFPRINLMSVFGGPAAASDNCASSGITTERPFYADQAPAGSKQFGPNQGYTDKQTAFKTLTTVMHCDYYVAATEVDFRGAGSNLSVDQINATAKTYGGDKKAWSDAVQGFLDDVDLAKSYTVNEPKHYCTLGAIPHGKEQPTLFSACPDHPAGWVLVLAFKDGTNRGLRIICLFQPVEISFPHVPPETSVCTGNKCGNTQNCTGSGCDQTGCKTGPCPTPSSTPKCCTSTTEVQIPVQESGQPTVAGPGAPTRRPGSNPTGPAPRPSSPPPPANGDGNNSGGGSGSASGGSQCGSSSSCTGGGQPQPSGPASTPTPVAPDPTKSGDPGL